MRAGMRVEKPVSASGLAPCKVSTLRPCDGRNIQSSICQSVVSSWYGPGRYLTILEVLISPIIMGLEIEKRSLWLHVPNN
jgi:hypothetical protein